MLHAWRQRLRYCFAPKHGRRAPDCVGLPLWRRGPRKYVFPVCRKKKEETKRKRNKTPRSEGSGSNQHTWSMGRRGLYACSCSCPPLHLPLPPLALVVELLKPPISLRVGTWTTSAWATTPETRIKPIKSLWVSVSADPFQVASREAKRIVLHVWVLSIGSTITTE